MTDFTEKELYEAFGLGEKEREPAEPVPAEETHAEEGEKEQEAAAPAREPQEEVPTAGDGLEADEKAPEGADGDAARETQTLEQRRENAARRRQAEQQQAVEQAVAAALAEERRKNEAAMGAFFAQAAMKNTITGEPITNMEQFQKWTEDYNQERLDRELKNGKLSAEGLATAIGSHPIVKQAQALVNQNAQEKRGQEEAAAKARVDQEIAKIHEIDASISTVEDLFKAPYGRDLYDLVKRGYSITDAHYLLNRERLEQAKVEAARQQGMNNARSKAHMVPTGSARGGGSVSVPAADLAMFRQFNPGATDAEIQAYYNHYLKRQGG